MTTRFLVGVLVAALTLVAASGAARADDAQVTEAEALFQHGVDLMKADNCPEAVPAFLKSEALDSSAATLLNLGTCYARLGRKATAWKTYQKAASAAAAEKDDALRERALQAMDIVGPTLTKIQIVTPKDAKPLSLRINGETLPNYDGLPIPLDPGESVIEASSPGREPWRRTVTADELGATLVIEVPDLREAPPLPLAVHPVQPDVRRQPADYRVPAAIVGGAGVVGIVVGSIFGFSAQSSYNESQQHCTGNACTQAGIDDRDRARTQATVSTVTLSVGLAAAVTGIVLWPVSPAQTEPRASARSSAPLNFELDGRGLLVESRRW